MIFLIEHEAGNSHRFLILVGYKELELSQFAPVKNLFFCETLDEAIAVMDELQEMSK